MKALLAALAAVAWTGCSAPRPPAFDPDSIQEAYAQSPAALMWPGAARGFQITPEGDLYNGEWRVRVTAEAGTASAAKPKVIAFEERWMPIAQWTRESGPVRWEFEAVAMAEPAPRDSGLLVSLVSRAVNRGRDVSEARLTLALEPPGEAPIFVAWDAPERPSPPLRWGHAGADTAHGFCDRSSAGTRLEQIWSLAPGESRELRVVLPAYPTPGSRLAGAARRGHQAWAVASRRHWRDVLASAASFALGDPEVEDALRAARVFLLCCRERRGSRWIPIGGPFQYRDVWLRDGARLIHALAISGHVPEARALARSLLEFQWPNGAFLSQRGQPDGTGQALWAIEQALLRPEPAPELELYVEAARRAVRWMEWQRDLGRRAGWRFGTMMPYAEPHDAEMAEGHAQIVGTDLWCMAGYRAASALMRGAGHAQEAAAVDAARERYRDDFFAALERTSSTDVPPTWQQVGRDWGNMAAAWPCAVLPSEHPRMIALARRLWSEAGGAGLACYGRERDSLHYYVGADLAIWALLAGRRASADSVLDAMLRWRTASGAAGEMFHRNGGFGKNLPPHPTSAAALVALVRNSLIFDDGDTLRLTLGARERWWRGARVRRAPTRWGLLDLTFRQAGTSAEWRWSRVPVWTALTMPPGARLAGPPPSPLVPGRHPGEILAPPGTGAARVALAVNEPPR